MTVDCRAAANQEVARFLCWLQGRKASHEIAMRSLNNYMAWPEYAKPIEMYQPDNGEIRVLNIETARIGHWIAASRALQWLDRREQGAAFGHEIAESMGLETKQIWSMMETLIRYGLVNMKVHYFGHNRRKSRYAITDLGHNVAARIYWEDGKPNLSKERVVDAVC